MTLHPGRIDLVGYKRSLSHLPHQLTGRTYNFVATPIGESQIDHMIIIAGGRSLCVFYTRQKIPGEEGSVSEHLEADAIFMNPPIIDYPAQPVLEEMNEFVDFGLIS
jgi:hypothetical protein